MMYMYIVYTRFIMYIAYTCTYIHDSILNVINQQTHLGLSVWVETSSVYPHCSFGVANKGAVSWLKDLSV